MARPFRLQTVARLREATRDARRAQLADALRAAQVLERQRQKLEGEIAELGAMRRDAIAVGATDVSRVLSTNRYELTLRTQQADLGDNLAKIEAEIERRRQALAEAEREVRALDLLRERQEQADRDAAKRREATRLDEFTAIAHTRGATT